jgi:hypothetical protein
MKKVISLREFSQEACLCWLRANTFCSIKCRSRVNCGADVGRRCHNLGQCAQQQQRIGVTHQPKQAPEHANRSWGGVASRVLRRRRRRHLYDPPHSAASNFGNGPSSSSVVGVWEFVTPAARSWPGSENNATRSVFLCAAERNVICWFCKVAELYTFCGLRFHIEGWGGMH